MSLIVLRNPNVKCIVTAETHGTVSISWTTTPPPDDVLSLIGGGLRSAYQSVHPKKGSILLKVRDGHVQQNQALWSITLLDHHAIFVIPKVSAITAIASEC